MKIDRDDLNATSLQLSVENLDTGARRRGSGVAERRYLTRILSAFRDRDLRIFQPSGTDAIASLRSNCAMT